MQISNFPRQPSKSSRRQVLAGAGSRAAAAAVLSVNRNAICRHGAFAFNFRKIFDQIRVINNEMRYGDERKNVDTIGSQKMKKATVDSR